MQLILTGALEAFSATEKESIRIKGTVKNKMRISSDSKMKIAPKQKETLLSWYMAHQRPLPWRKTKDPYAIWISETMLQQTTTQAVIPYFENFIKDFPTLSHLAHAPEEEVLARWSGLGYYSRARNLHRAAKMLNELKTFPETYSELIMLPGFGPYTSRAVSSLAFEEPVGVLDGNVIRVLTRVHDLDLEWWKSKDRALLQDLADQWVQGNLSSQMNQGLMELGATICTPRSPSCLLCPLKNSCLARKHETISLRPKSKPKKRKIRLHWIVKPVVNNDQILLIHNHTYPVLKAQALPSGEMKVIEQKPKKFHFVHFITRFEIFVQVDSSQKKIQAQNGEWVSFKDLIKKSPSSLVRKVVQNLESEEIV